MNKKITAYIYWTIILVATGYLFYWISEESDKNKIQKEKENKAYLEKNKDIILEEETSYDIQSRDHINIGDEHDKYTTNIPTSGPHAGAVLGGFYKESLLDENAVHNLEHGYIWITYKNISDKNILKIEELVKKYPGSTIASQREKNDFDGIGLASWGNLLKLKVFDKILIEDFIKRNKNKSPEKLAR